MEGSGFREHLWSVECLGDFSGEFRVQGTFLEG